MNYALDFPKTKRLFDIYLTFLLKTGSLTKIEAMETYGISDKTFERDIADLKQYLGDRVRIDAEPDRIVLERKT